jgi:hypothetical protein
VIKIMGVSPVEAWIAGWTVFCNASSCPAQAWLMHYLNGIWTRIPTSNWLAFYDISKVNGAEWWATGKLKTMEYALLHYQDGNYTIVSAGGEDVLGVSMLPDGTGFARGVGSLLQLKFLTQQVYLPMVAK